MSEEFSGQGNAKLLNCVNSVKYYNNKLCNSETDGDELNLSYDHMYATNNENEDDEDIQVTNTDSNCQSAESEVSFFKELLILHLDFIQQQSDDILDREKTILILQQENEMLKERLRCLEHNIPYKEDKQSSIHLNSQLLGTNPLKDMTQDSGPCEEDNKEKVEISFSYLNGGNCSVDLIKLEPENVLSENRPEQTADAEDNSFALNEPQVNITEAPLVNGSDIITETEVECNNSFELNSFPLNSSSEFDPMRNLRLSIRRKRVCSNSSAVSNIDSPAEEKQHHRRFRKRRKRTLKESQVLTTPEPYLVQPGEVNLLHPADLDPSLSPNKTLEVPRWRVKVYASCYTMEGTENLDDEVFHKRHSRLEYNERRRKRWDVQRIREQRVIEKLKQRQERAASGSKSDNGLLLQSLWPKVDDVKFIEVCDELPVSAFGYPVPKIPPSEFSLPWMNNPSILTKKVPARKSTARRKLTKR